MKFILLLGLTMFGGCAAVERVGMSFLYKKAPLPASQVRRDLSYFPGSANLKHRLDLFLPAAKSWPVLVFVYGGGWENGDKALRIGGEDVYGNIGRFFAAHGIGVAVINYRLQPEVTWRQQVADVADAVAWVNNHLASDGGEPARIFRGGPSAGGHLASFVALNREVAARHGVPRLAGVICVSGAGLDMADEETYRLGNRVAYYEKLFDEGGKNPAWMRTASPVTFVTKDAPPFLILYAEGDSAALRRQAQHFHDVLDRRGVRNRVVVVPGESHTRIVLTLSRDDKTAGPAMLEFLGAR